MISDKASVVKKLCGEIALITRNEPENIKPEESLHNNGIDSMSLLEILLFIKNEWGIDYLDTGLPMEAQHSIEALAEHICNSRESK